MSIGIQQAVYGALAGDATLGGLVTGVYDAPAPAAVLPYVTIGDCIVLDWSTASFTGAEYRLTIDIWTRTEGQRSAKAILDATVAALGRLPSATATLRIVWSRVAGWRLLREPDGVTQHGVIDLRLRTHPLGV